MDKYLRRGCWTIGGMTLTVVMIGMILAMPGAHAEIQTSTDNVSVYIPVSCSMTYDASASTAHTRMTVSGQMEENIGTSYLKMACNDKGGFVVYAIGATDGTEGATYMSSPLGADYRIPTTSSSVAPGNSSSWGMKLAAVTGDNAPNMVEAYAGDNYVGVPSTWTRVAYKDSSTSKNAMSSFTTTYAVYTSVTQSAGTYTGQVKYVLLHPDSMQTPTTTLESAFALAGKKKMILKKNGDMVEEGSEGADQIPDEDIEGRYYKMQDMTGWICGAGTYVDNNNTTQLIDVRDKNVYYVSKLRDGNCWMTQNLALNLTAGVALTSDTTDLNDNSRSGAYATGYDFDGVNNIISWKPATTTITFNGTGMSGWSNDNNKAYSARKTDGTLTGHTATGVHYNWSAAIASNNSSSYNNNFGSTYGNVDKNPQNSICPKGWRLPTISSVAARNEFGNLNNIYNNGSTTSDAGLIASPLWFVRSGYVYNNTLNNYGVYGYYWSSVVIGSYGAYVLDFGVDDYLDPQYDDYRYYGFSVRCVAR